MVQSSTKTFVNVLLLLSLQVINSHEYTFVEEKPDNKIYDEDSIKVEEQKFNERIDGFPPQADIFKRRFRSVVDTGVIPVYKTVNQCQSFCKMRFQPIDLGKEYYPRYLQTGMCQPNSCDKFYQCVEKNYEVKVLRKREGKDGDDTIYSSLPKPLRDFWVAEVISVGVACECVIDVSFTDNE